MGAPEVTPPGKVWNQLTNEWVDAEEGVKDSSFLPFGMEDWINPAGWSRMIAKKIAGRAATGVAQAVAKEGVKETAEQGSKGAVSSILARLKGQIPEEKLDELALQSVKGGPTAVHLTTEKGVQATFQPGTPLHKELSERGRELMSKPAQNLTYGTATPSKKFEMDGGVLERARRKRAKQVLELLNNRSQSNENKE